VFCTALKKQHNSSRATEVNYSGNIFPKVRLSLNMYIQHDK
jgi:hypothetical protein